MARADRLKRFSFFSDRTDKAGSAAGVLASRGGMPGRKGKQYVPRALQAPQRHQQLADQRAEVEALRRYNAALKTRLSAAEATVTAHSLQATTAAAELNMLQEQLQRSEQALLTQQTMRQAAEAALPPLVLAEHLAKQLLAATAHSSVQQTLLFETQQQLSVMSQQCATQQGQLSALQHELDVERRAHQLTHDRELQATAALQLAQQQYSHRTADLAASQQQTSILTAEVGLLRSELLTADSSLQRIQAAHATSMAHLKQQLQDSNAARQQHRETAARAQAEAGAARFGAARLAAHVTHLQSQLAEARQQQEAASAATDTNINSLQQAYHQLAAEHDAAVSCCQTLQQQHAAFSILFVATWQQLQATLADLSAATGKLAEAQKAAHKVKQQASTTITALQYKLNSSTQRLQQLREAAAKAWAAAAARGFVAARLGAQISSLHKQVSVLSLERGAAIRQLQQAKADSAMSQQALAAVKQQHSSSAAQLTDSQQQLERKCASAAHLQQQLSATQQELATLKHTSASAIAKLQQQVATQQHQKQQQREAAARFAAEAAALRFAAARLTARNQSLQAQLEGQAVDKQPPLTSAAAAVAPSHIVTVQHATTQSETMDTHTVQLGKVTACLAETRQQLVSTTEQVGRLQQELQACRAACNISSITRESFVTVHTAALQQRAYMQQCAARAYARAQAAEWRLAKQAAQYKTLQQQHTTAAAAAAATISSMELRLQELSCQHVATVLPQSKQCCMQPHAPQEAADVAAVLDCSAVAGSNSSTGPASSQLQHSRLWGSGLTEYEGFGCSDQAVPALNDNAAAVTAAVAAAPRCQRK